MRSVQRLAVVAHVGAALEPRRGYFWPYTEDMVPEGVNPSAFQASTVPSVRKNIIREYALGPLFGARTPLCLLGFFPPQSPAGATSGALQALDVLGGNAPGAASYAATGGRALAVELIEKKKVLCAALADLLSCDVKDVELGQITLAKEMMMYRAHTPESPRLADGPGGSVDYAERRRSRYARQPIRARAFMDVYVSDDMFDSPEEKRLFAHFLQERILNHAKEAASFDATRDAFSRSDDTAPDSSPQPSSPSPSPSPSSPHPPTTETGKVKLSAQQREAFEQDMEERARVLDGVSHLRELGVVYCEVPVKMEDVDGHDYNFDKLHGEEIDHAVAEQVLDRWERRLSS